MTLSSLQKEFPTMSLYKRRLCLGSVSSLSFEEEENSDHFGLYDSVHDEGSISVSSIGDNHQQHSQQSHELHELLTHSLEEQVEFLIKSTTGVCWTLGLHQTLYSAVHDILKMSEKEPYGVRGATIILKMRSFKGETEKHLGTISVDVNTVSTFNLILVLNEGRHFGVTLKNWMSQWTGAKQGCVISDRYSLTKEKLYRSDSGTTLSRFQI